MARPKNVTCPLCEEKFEMEPDLEVGDTTSCPSCYADLKILSLHPIEVEEAMGGVGGGAGEEEDGFRDEDVGLNDDEDFGKFR